MKTFWAGLSGREQLLIVGGGAFLALVAVVMLIISPLISYRSDARAAYEEGSETYLLVGRAASRPDASQTLAVEELRNIVTTSARRWGLEILQVTSTESPISVRLSSSPPETLYGWLADLEARYAITVRDATIRQSNDGTGVVASLSVARG